MIADPFPTSAETVRLAPVANRVADFDNTEIAFRHHSDFELRKTYWLFRAMNNAWLTSVGTAAVSWAMKAGLPVKGLIKQTLFRHFCGGETIEECEATALHLEAENIQTVLDYSVEGEKTEAGFEQAVKEVAATISKAKSNRHFPFAVFKITCLAGFELLAKVSAGETLSQADQEAFERARRRVAFLCGLAADGGLPVMIDAEESWIQPAIDRIATEMMQKHNREKCLVLNTFQMYRHDRLAFLKASLETAKREGFYLGVKLVRGAYMEKERKRAADFGYASPIHAIKADTDRDYDSALNFCVLHRDHISLCAGTHNEASSSKLASLLQSPVDVPALPTYFSQLYGMGDHISYNLAAAGFKVAKYVPFGPIKFVLPYLIRRAEENTSIAGHVSRELRLIESEMKRRGL
ncbi:MAG: proline dehydrogenase family protein [Rhizobacter sp.]|nr:proline dehydrogenase family protein [Chlorobiales bacterium]